MGEASYVTPEQNIEKLPDVAKDSHDPDFQTACIIAQPAAGDVEPRQGHDLAGEVPLDRACGDESARTSRQSGTANLRRNGLPELVPLGGLCGCHHQRRDPES